MDGIVGHLLWSCTWALGYSFTARMVTGHCDLTNLNQQRMLACQYRSMSGLQNEEKHSLGNEREALQVCQSFKGAKKNRVFILLPIFHEIIVSNGKKKITALPCHKLCFSFFGRYTHTHNIQITFLVPLL